MIYACAGSMRGHAIADRPAAGCGWEHRVWLGLGVEGPPEMREAGLFIPAPFFCGGCPDCGGRLHHDRWNEDETFEEPRPIPEQAARFHVPEPSEWAKLGDYGGADYHDPSGSTR